MQYNGCYENRFEYALWILENCYTLLPNISNNSSGTQYVFVSSWLLYLVDVAFKIPGVDEQQKKKLP